MEPRREIPLDYVGGLYSVKAAARRLGITYVALDTRIRRQGIPTYRIGNERLVKLSDVGLAGTAAASRG